MIYRISFWTLRFPPRETVELNRLQLDALRMWGLKPNTLADCRIFLPTISQRMVGDEEYFTLRTADVLASEWCAILGRQIYSPQGHVVSQTMEALAGRNYDLSDMISYVSSDSNGKCS